MLKIYIAHSTSFPFQEELYQPIRNSVLNAQHHIFLPHESPEFIDSKEKIRHSDLLIAEVSYPSTGEGIELGWADCFAVPIVCLHKEGTKPSGSLQAVTKTLIGYRNYQDLIEKMSQQISTFNK